jgi:hypothetical protein
MVFAAAALKEIFDIGFWLQPTRTVDAMIYLGALLALLYGYSWILAALTEAYTDAVRSRLSFVILALRHQANFLVHKKVFE